MPQLDPNDRSILKEIHSDTDRLFARYAFNELKDAKRRKGAVELLYAVVGNRKRSVTLIVARFLPSLPQEHEITKALGHETRKSLGLHDTEKPTEKLIEHKFPIDCGDERREILLSAVVPLRPEILQRALDDHISELEWPECTLATVTCDFLQIPDWPATPASWIVITEFFYTDRIITSEFYRRAKQYYPLEPGENRNLSIKQFIELHNVRRDEFVSVLRDWAVVTTISNSGERMLKSDPKIDLRAETLGLPLATEANRVFQRLNSAHRPLDQDGEKYHKETDSLSMFELLYHFSLRDRVLLQSKLQGYSRSEISRGLQCYAFVLFQSAAYAIDDNERAEILAEAESFRLSEKQVKAELKRIGEAIKANNIPEKV